MGFLDLRTVIFITGAMGALMALVLYFQRLNYPRSISGMGHWALGSLVAFLSTLLFGLRGTVPAVVSTGLANVMLFLAGALLLAGTCSFLGRHLPRAFPVAVVVIGSAPMWWLSQSDAQYPARLVFICTVMGLLFGLHAYIIWRHAPRSFGSRFALTVLAGLTLVMGVRGATALQDPPSGGLFTPSPLQSVYIVSYSLGILLIAIAGLLMASERLRKELEHLVTHDSLTGALARRALFELGGNEMARSRRNGSPLSALMLDLDHFKDINDRHGHHIGDLVLRDFVQRTLAALRQPDLLGRYGGEEFVALLPDTDAAQARRVAERIRASVPTDPSLPLCSVSIGVATLHPGDEELDALIDRADAGLYRAKALGRDRVECDLSAHEEASA
jgi:diguanylate cyclase (GGDEF)-like protein